MGNTTIPHFAFTSRVNGVAKSLRNDVVLCNGETKIKYTALWDTGATNTCISNEAADALNLQCTGMTQIKTPSGIKTVKTYLIDIILPNNVTVKDIAVCDSEIGNQGIGALIGMDIISAGEFNVSTFEGNTWFTFRMPAKKHTDYVEQINFENLIGKKHGKGKRKHK